MNPHSPSRTLLQLREASVEPNPGLPTSAAPSVRSKAPSRYAVLLVRSSSRQQRQSRFTMTFSDLSDPLIRMRPILKLIQAGLHRARNPVHRPSSHRPTMPTPCPGPTVALLRPTPLLALSTGSRAGTLLNPRFGLARLIPLHRGSCQPTPLETSSVYRLLLRSVEVHSGNGERVDGTGS
jgi:hypothetical protein